MAAVRWSGSADLGSMGSVLSTKPVQANMAQTQPKMLPRRSQRECVRTMRSIQQAKIGSVWRISMAPGAIWPLRINSVRMLSMLRPMVRTSAKSTMKRGVQMIGVAGEVRFVCGCSLCSDIAICSSGEEVSGSVMLSAMYGWSLFV